jgi:hypothetical protein
LEFLLVGLLLVVGSTLVFAGAIGMTPSSRTVHGATQIFMPGRSLFSLPRFARSKRRPVSQTDLILTDLLNEIAELRREIADLRSTRF